MRINSRTGITPAAPVFIDELAAPLSINGALTYVQSIPLPTELNAAGMRLTLPTGDAHGLASLANDGSRIAIAGLNVSVGLNATAGKCEAVVGTVDAYGNVEVITSLGSGSLPYPGGTVYGAATNDGNDFWLNGAATSGGVYYIQRGSRGSPTAALLDVNVNGWSSIAAQVTCVYACPNGSATTSY